MSVPTPLKKYVAYLVKIAAAVGVLAAALGAILPALGAAGISVPAWAAAVIGTIGGIVAAFTKWAADNGVSQMAVRFRSIGR